MEYSSIIQSYDKRALHRVFPIYSSSPTLRRKSDLNQLISLSVLITRDVPYLEILEPISQLLHTLT